MSGPVVLPREPKPPLRERAAAHVAIGAARLIARLPPRHLRALLGALRTGAVPATYDQALAARTAVTGTSAHCAGPYCVPRSVATALLCRLRGTWPTWCTGVRTGPFAAHAWVEAEGRPVGEPAGSGCFSTLLSVPPRERER
ncbi:lasso peptide biosynthesis B2 protein [Streptomyces sp. NRRL B-1677]|uniref:Lasso peptide biosynthesis B2 protein n=1 Tax=Streptomyces klenkii TaxID=1420899 RepID=A0A3B0BL92_9ACTN|nr:lasso peptide biosynthesis B2 protein [Streptomyces sp. NRRL B-1677]RKN72908.1 lasso peptide biosynthesis B2 protein [Streptomyces klenkii]